MFFEVRRTIEIRQVVIRQALALLYMSIETGSRTVLNTVIESSSRPFLYDESFPFRLVHNIQMKNASVMKTLSISTSFLGFFK
jgi:hypothetical protein